MIHEEIVTFEVAKLAKEKGFPQDVFGDYEMKSSCYLEDGRFYKEGVYIPLSAHILLPRRAYCKDGCERGRTYTLRLV